MCPVSSLECSGSAWELQGYVLAHRSAWSYNQALLYQVVWQGFLWTWGHVPWVRAIRMCALFSTRLLHTYYAPSLCMLSTLTPGSLHVETVLSLSRHLMAT